MVNWRSKVNQENKKAAVTSFDNEEQIDKGYEADTDEPKQFSPEEKKILANKYRNEVEQVNNKIFERFTSSSSDKEMSR